jgi:hypothetical protein
MKEHSRLSVNGSLSVHQHSQVYIGMLATVAITVGGSVTLTKENNVTLADRSTLVVNGDLNLMSNWNLLLSENSYLTVTEGSHCVMASNQEVPRFSEATWGVQGENPEGVMCFSSLVEMNAYAPGLVEGR